MGRATFNRIKRTDGTPRYLGVTDTWIRQLAERLAPADTDPELAVDLRRAAVLMLLYREEGDLRMPLIVRPRDQGMHGGQFALPGGAYDPADVTLKRTALREACEEVAVLPSTVEVLGRLPPVQVRVSGFVVVPFVGWSLAIPRLYPHDAEVERIIHMPIAMLRDADAWPRCRRQLGRAMPRCLSITCPREGSGAPRLACL